MSEADLRAMVREVLRDALAQRRPVAGATDGPATGAAPSSQATPLYPGGPAIATEAVTVTSDADLAAFVQRIVRLLDAPATADAVRGGRYRFTLSSARAASAQDARPSAPQGDIVTLGGTVTEAVVGRVAAGRTIRLAPGAVLTPLARDKARALGLTIERKR